MDNIITFTEIIPISLTCFKRKGDHEEIEIDQSKTVHEANNQMEEVIALSYILLSFTSTSRLFEVNKNNQMQEILPLPE